MFGVQLAYLELRECARFVEEVESELRLRNRNKKHDGDGDGDGGDARVGGGEAGEEGGKGVEGAVHAEARHRETMREGRGGGGRGGGRDAPCGVAGDGRSRGGTGNAIAIVPSDSTLLSTITAARLKRTLLRMSLVQDCMDAAVVIGDIRGRDNLLTKPWLVGTLGLCSALVGVYDKWVTTA